MVDNRQHGPGWRVYLWVLPVLFLLLFAIPSLLTGETGAETITYSQFQQALAAGQVQQVAIAPDVISGTYRTPHDGYQRFTVYRVEPDLAADLGRYKVDFAAVPNPAWLGAALSWAGTLILFALVWYGMRGSMPAGGLARAGQSHARIYVNENTGVTFDDVAGVDEAKADLLEIIAFLKNPREYGRLGAHVPTGILLVGPPGTGKTLLAKAVAGEAHVPFFSISGSEFIELFVGLGAARVRDLFRQAKARSPSIIFIDELDALGRARGLSLESHDEREQTLNQLLAELDGFDPREGVVVLAATNRPEVLDPALLRGGRFDRQVLVDRPDMRGRLAILTVHAKSIRLAPDTDLAAVAAMTTGFSGADLANLVNEAALEATRRRADAVGQADFTAALERIVAGLEKRSRILTPFERRVTAYHEMGHALVAMALPGGETVHKVSIVPRGIGALGYTIQRPTEDRYLMTRQELDDKLCVLLGGRASEALVFGHISTGAADDLGKATDIARSMALTYGMEDDIGAVVYEKPRATFLSPVAAFPAPHDYSEAVAGRIDAAVTRRIQNALRRATDILQNNRSLLETGVKELLQTETLDEVRLTAFSGLLRPAPAAATLAPPPPEPVRDTAS